jgi:O-antigen/teichoic acid export membrane protein
MTATGELPSATDAAPEAERSVRARFATGALWSVSGAAVSRGLSLAGFIVAGRLLGAAGFGELGIIQSTQALFGVLAGGALGLTATRFVAAHHGADRVRAARCFALALKIAIVSGGTGALVLCVCATLIAESLLHAPHLVNELRVATGLLVCTAITGVQTGAIAGLGDFRTIALLATLRGACLVAFLVGGIEVAGVLGALTGLVLTEAVAIVANHLVLRRRMPHAGAIAGPTRQDFGDVLRFGGLAVLGSITTMAALWAGQVMLVSQPDGFAALGLFNAAERWRQLLLFLPAALAPIVLSMLSNLHGRADSAGYRQVFGMNLWIVAATVVVPMIAIVALAPLAMSLFGAEYRAGATTAAILAGSAVAVVCNDLLGQIVVSRGAIGWRAGLDVFLSAVLVLTAWPLVAWWQDRGLALAHLVAYSATAVALIIPAAKYLRQPAGTPAQD